MESDPTAILKKNIEASKKGELNVQVMRNPSIEQREESDEEPTLPKGKLIDNGPLSSISESLTPVMEKKWKSHTPNPRKKPPAGTTRTTPYILGVSLKISLS